MLNLSHSVAIILTLIGFGSFGLMVWYLRLYDIKADEKTKKHWKKWSGILFAFSEGCHLVGALLNSDIQSAILRAFTLILTCASFTLWFMLLHDNVEDTQVGKFARIVTTVVVGCCFVCGIFDLFFL